MAILSATPSRRRLLVLKPYLATIVVVASCSALGWFTWLLGLAGANIVMVFLAGVILIAARFGHWPSVLASILSVLIFDYFFVAPVFAFVPTDAEYIVDLVAMLGIGILISELTARLRLQVRTTQQHERVARQQERTTAQLYRMTRELSESAGIEFLIAAASRQLTDIFSGDVVVVPSDDAGHLSQQFDKDSTMLKEPLNAAAACWVIQHGAFAGFGTEQFPQATALFVPMVGSARTLGVLGVRPSDPTSFNDSDRRRLLETCANLIALSIERDQSSLAAHEARLQVETEQFRNYVLSSVSHDLRSPLAMIATTASSLLEESTESSPFAKRRLSIVVEESQRLSRQVENLLANARITSGPIVLHRQWHVLDEIVEVVLTRLQTELSARNVDVQIDEDLPLVLIEGNLMEQALMNVLDNAIHYTPADTDFEISATRSSEGLIELRIADRGPGIPPGSESRIFEKFFSNTRFADRKRGIGLGLAICKAIINAHGGQIRAANRPGGGAEFTITLPCPQQNLDTLLEQSELLENS